MSHPISGVLYRPIRWGTAVSVIYLGHLLPSDSIVLPSGANLVGYSGGQPSILTGIHALSPSATPPRYVAIPRRELLPHVLTLAPPMLFGIKSRRNVIDQIGGAVIFFCVAASSRILPVRKRSVLWSPDFPPAILSYWRQAVRLTCFVLFFDWQK